MNPQMHDLVVHMKSGLTMGAALLVACALGVVAYAVARRRGAAGMVPRGEVAATTACLAFTLLTLQLCYLAWNVLAPMTGPGGLGPASELPLAQRVLDAVAGVHRLPTFRACFAYALLALGTGMWLAALTEARLGEMALPRLKRITMGMGLGSLTLLGLSVWSLTSLWSTLATISKDLPR